MGPSHTGYEFERYPRLISSAHPSTIAWHRGRTTIHRSSGAQRRLRRQRRRRPAPRVAPEVAIPGPKPRARRQAPSDVGNGFDGAVGRISPALVLQDAAAVDQVALGELREPVEPVDLSGGQVLVPDRALMAADDPIVVIGDEAVADGPLVELGPDEGRRHRELRPAGADLHRKPDRIEDGVDRVTRQTDDKESERPDVVPGAEGDLFDKLPDEDRLAVDPLLDFRIRALHA